MAPQPFDGRPQRPLGFLSTGQVESDGNLTRAMAGDPELERPALLRWKLPARELEHLSRGARPRHGRLDPGPPTARGKSLREFDTTRALRSAARSRRNIVGMSTDMVRGHVSSDDRQPDHQRQISAAPLLLTEELEATEVVLAQFRHDLDDHTASLVVPVRQLPQQAPPAYERVDLGVEEGPQSLPGAFFASADEIDQSIERVCEGTC